MNKYISDFVVVVVGKGWPCTGVICQFKFNVNQNEKRKQKRNGWSDLREGASRPPRRFPRLRFCFRFRFDLRWIWIFPKPPSPGSKAWKKNQEKNEVWLKWKFRSWRSILTKNHQNRNYPQVFLATLKFGTNRSMCSEIFCEAPLSFMHVHVEIRTSVYASNFRRITPKIRQNTFLTICKNRFFKYVINWTTFVPRKIFRRKIVVFRDFLLILQDLGQFWLQHRLPWAILLWTELRPIHRSVRPSERSVGRSVGRKDVFRKLTFES